MWRWILRKLDGARLVAILPGEIQWSDDDIESYHVLLFQGRRFRHRQFVGDGKSMPIAQLVPWQRAAIWIAGGESELLNNDEEEDSQDELPSNVVRLRHPPAVQDE